MKHFILLLVLLSPFAQVLYLMDLMKEMEAKEFISMFFRATILTFGVFVLFALVGEPILKDFFQVQLESLQIFGGLIMLLVAYRYIVEGPRANLLIKGELTDLAPKVSLPYMVGPGAIWLSILMGQIYGPLLSLGMIAGVMVLNFILVAIAYLFIHSFSKRKETLVGKYFSILMRTNALFIGAIAVEMIVKGLKAMIQNPV